MNYKNTIVEASLKELNENFRDVYKFRTLEENDYYKDYFNLLSQLTIADKPEYELFVKRFEQMKNSGLMNIFVVECLITNKIIATITNSIELKFIRNLGSICHIEDFVIDKEHRSKKIGSKLLNLSIEYSKGVGCYKILLEARDEVMGFYEKCGFKKKANGMTIYL